MLLPSSRAPSVGGQEEAALQFSSWVTSSSSHALAVPWPSSSPPPVAVGSTTTSPGSLVARTSSSCCSARQPLQACCCSATRPRSSWQSSRTSCTSRDASLRRSRTSCAVLSDVSSWLSFAFLFSSSQFCLWDTPVLSDEISESFSEIWHRTTVSVTASPAPALPLHSAVALSSSTYCPALTAASAALASAAVAPARVSRSVRSPSA
mmetsp:Transcript_28970/g.51842  ORF Transcript_28970/g.51842 Transcript_28970/m.51842 type:complete len:207 (-) Transcript_28970:1190-1810(-)